MLLVAMAAGSGVAALLFASIGGFLWIQQHYDTVTACLLLACCYLFVTTIVTIIALVKSNGRIIPPPNPISATENSPPDLDLLIQQIIAFRGPAAKKAISIAAVAIFTIFAFIDSKARRKKSEPNS